MKFSMNRKLCGFLFVCLCMLSTEANAWFFFFLPGSAVSGISDAITGAKGDICVRESAKVGDILNSPNGNTGTIKSLSGTSSRCRNAALPIRAEVEFSFTYNSKAGIEIPDDYESKPITDLQRFYGRLLLAESKTERNRGIAVSTVKKGATADPVTVANRVEKAQMNVLVDAKSSNSEKIVINGVNALRFEVEGKLKGIFGRQMTYLVTVLDGDSEILVVSAWAETADYEKVKAELRKLAGDISGLKVIPVAAIQEQGKESHEAAGVGTGPAVVPTVEAEKSNAVSRSGVVGASAAPTLPAGNASNANSAVDKLRELAQLLKEGLISEKDYENKKQEILKGL